jgi:hypothetical protein
MASNIHVTSTIALEELEAAIGRFSSKAQEAIEAAEHEIARRMDTLDQIIVDYKRAVNGWQRAYDEPDSEEDDVSSIRHKLEEAEDNLGEAKQWQRRAEESYSEYRKRAKQVSYLADEHSNKARAFLKDRIKELYDYAGLKPHLAGSASANSHLAQPGVLDAMLVAAEATIGSIISGGEAAVAAMTGLPLPQGFGWVRLGEIRPDEMSDLPAKNDYKKNELSESDMREGLELLRTRILPEIQKNPAATIEHFAELDAVESRSGSKSLANIFRAYFGTNDHIWVDRFKGDQFFGIGNGRHRIRAARDLGWSAIPARVVEVDRH